jgi:hypothetical protein
VLRRFKIDWQIILIAPPIFLELLRQAIATRFPLRIYAPTATGPVMTAIIVLGTMLCVAIPIKIWNSARIEHRLQEQEKLLMASRRCCAGCCGARTISSPCAKSWKRSMSTSISSASASARIFR